MNLRIIICIVMLFLTNILNASANGRDDLNYQIDVIPIAGPNQAEIEVVVKNLEEFPLDFEFPTSQIFEMIITDKSGNEVYVYSKGRYFLQAFQTITIQPHESIKRVVKWNYEFEGKRVPKGEYLIYTALKPISINNKPVQNKTKLMNNQKLYVPRVNEVFHNLKVSGTKGDYAISGKVKKQHKRLYYVVEDGHVEIVKESMIKVTGAKQEWEEFNIDIHIPKERLPHNATLILYLYEKNNEGKKVNINPLVLERLKE